MHSEQDEMKREINQNNVIFYHQIHKSCQRTEEKIDHRFNEFTRRLEKMATTDEASTVQFKSALDQHHQMTSMIGDLVDKRNKEVKFTMTTPQLSQNRHTFSNKLVLQLQEIPNQTLGFLHQDCHQYLHSRFYEHRFQTMTNQLQFVIQHIKVVS